MMSIAASFPRIAEEHLGATLPRISCWHLSRVHCYHNVYMLYWFLYFLPHLVFLTAEPYRVGPLLWGEWQSRCTKVKLPVAPLRFHTQPHHAIPLSSSLPSHLFCPSVCHVLPITVTLNNMSSSNTFVGRPQYAQMEMWSGGCRRLKISLASISTNANTSGLESPFTFLHF
jgi:hypothetical protein